METQLFYWTGVVLWWIGCGFLVLFIALFAVWLPCYLMVKTRRAVWNWIWAAKIARHGFSQRELQEVYIGSYPQLPKGVELADIVDWVGRVKDRAEKAQAKSARIKER